MTRIQRLAFATQVPTCFLLLAFNLCAFPSSVANSAEAKYPLMVIDVDGSNLRELTSNSLPSLICGSPDWSPDGKWIAFDAWRIGEQLTDSHVYVLSVGGKEHRDMGPGAMPTWSPDGSQIVCHTYSPNEIVVINEDGSGRETILNRLGSPRWCPRHNRIVSIGGRSPSHSLYAYDLKTGKERPFLRGPYSANLGFGISPDGSQFCFGDAGGGLAIASLDETTFETKVRWLRKTGEFNHNSWSPDGKRVVYHWTRTEGKPPQLYLQATDSEDPPRRLPGQNAHRINVSPDWSPDGKRIVFCSHVSY